MVVTYAACVQHFSFFSLNIFLTCFGNCGRSIYIDVDVVQRFGGALITDTETTLLKIDFLFFISTAICEATSKLSLVSPYSLRHKFVEWGAGGKDVGGESLLVDYYLLTSPFRKCR